MWRGVWLASMAKWRGGKLAKSPGIGNGELIEANESEVMA